MKCSGGTPCTRCASNHCDCTYSVQKPTGRPRKRFRPADEEPLIYPPLDFDMSWLGEDDLSSLTAGTVGLGGLDVSPLTPASPFAIPASGCCSAADVAATAPCTCVSAAYLTITSLQTPPGSDLSYSLASLQAAIPTAIQLLECAQCAGQILAATQNTYQLSTVLISIVDYLRKILVVVDANAQTDSRPEVSSFLNEIPAETQNMTAHQWRLFLRGWLKANVLGSGADKGASTITAIADRFAERQRKWHDDPAMYEEQAKLFGKCVATEYATDEQSRVCHKLVVQVQNCIKHLEL